MSFISNLSSIFKGNKPDPRILIACRKFFLAVETQEPFLHQLSPYTDRALSSERVGKNFTDFERFPAEYLNAHTDFMDAATSALEVIAVELKNFPVKKGKPYVTALNLFQKLYDLYLIHASAFAKSAKYVNIASAAGNVDSLKCEVDALVIAASGEHAPDPNVRSALLRDAEDMKLKAKKDAIVAAELGSKVTNAALRTRSLIANASKLIGV